MSKYETICVYVGALPNVRERLLEIARQRELTWGGEPSASAAFRALLEEEEARLERAKGVRSDA